jgi:hypothetical protein
MNLRIPPHSEKLISHAIKDPNAYAIKPATIKNIGLQCGNLDLIGTS